MTRLVLIAALLASPSPALAAARPNIIFIMSDDHAAHAISAYGSKVNQTPGLDRIARNGMLASRSIGWFGGPRSASVPSGEAPAV